MRHGFALLRLVVLFGGVSAEHDVSRCDRGPRAGSRRPHRYELVPVGIGKDGSWVRNDDDGRACRWHAAAERT